MADLPINANDRRSQAVVTNATTTSYSFDFPIFTEDGMDVWHTRGTTTTLLTLDTHYTVPSGSLNEENGGTISVILSALPLAVDDYFTFEGNTEIARPADWQAGGDYRAENVNIEQDTLFTIAQEQARDIAKCAKLPPEILDSDGVDPTLPTPLAGNLIGWNDDGTALENKGDASDIADAQSNAAAAAASAASASSSAATATTQAGNAAASAAAAAAVLDAAMFSNVVFLTSASSPYTVAQGNSGDLLSVDTSGGNVVINLPAISGLSLPFTLGIKKTSSDANTVTINRGGASDTIDGNTSKTLSAVVGTTLIPDTDPSPDIWTSADFGQALTVASQAEAEAGTDNLKYMTPLRVAQAVPSASDTVKGKIEIATNAEAQAGSATDKAIVPSNFVKSLASSGYIWLGPLLVQWGTQSVATSATISFPISFPNACLRVFGQFENGQATSSGIRSLTTTNFLLENGGSFTATSHWFAIGY